VSTVLPQTHTCESHAQHIRPIIAITIIVIVVERERERERPTDFEVDVVQNVEQLVSPLLDDSEVDYHVVSVDWYVQAQHVLENLA